jgi:hypothetical protein
MRSCEDIAWSSVRHPGERQQIGARRRRVHT